MIRISRTASVMLCFLVSGAAALAQSVPGNAAVKLSDSTPLRLTWNDALQVTPAATRRSAAKAKVQELGLGATVKIALFHGKRYRGYITDIADSSFQVTDTKTLHTHLVQFSSVNRIVGRPLPAPWDPIGNRILRAFFKTTSRFALGP